MQGGMCPVVFWVICHVKLVEVSPKGRGGSRGGGGGAGGEQGEPGEDSEAPDISICDPPPPNEA